MNARCDHLRWLARIAGAVLAAMVAWAGWPVRPPGSGTLEGLAEIGARPIGAPDLAWIAADGTEMSLTRRRRGWTHDDDSRRGIFDRPVRNADPGDLTRERPRSSPTLVATRELPFRLQLIGHFGEGADLSGIFSAEGLAGPLLARGGEELAELGLVVESIRPGAGADEGRDGVVARVWDRRTARAVDLAESVQARSGVGAAMLAPPGLPGEAIEFLVGEVVEFAGEEFRIESIGVSPAEVRLRRLAGSATEEEVEELSLLAAEDSES